MEVIGMSQGGRQPLELNASIETAKVSGDISSTNNINVDQKAVQNRDGKNTTVKNTKDAVDHANKILDDTQTHLKFEIYGKFNDVVVQVVDDDTNKVVREVPPKKLIDMVEKFCELSGFFMDKKA
ncbi:MAG: flagellar protein FlaG [Clostridium tyrobutyricum]|jgi:flagellar protein FlaG|uniref:flagellar protein FlaG n=1 Tax=Clostridium tyrobutyricum TaxID=1519 RepID=UPI0024331888|nr:flagellar protein FlaG [Clostridium tyrobutyricum]MCH4199090.1 flagellar protein FlaG [Clostridium tyrobutyricum]MCH4259670.1 flagellar protein FlaG [Clostridium tyrobutyricum]MCI1240119.1 flagellar protein FlaG [Clostridium tyrobutyricum]MCI1651625.1 flagellar protein FlaG [Clostridium tyrobutyricum]MCI1938473.1 flagellar protein FlaG [Clostridium tyrobutyricum]